MDVIAAAPANQVDLIRTETELRRIGFGLHFEFLNGVLGQNDRRRIQSGVRIGQTVQGVVIGLRPSAVDADGIPGSLAHLPLFPDRLHRARGDEQQVQEVPAVEGKFFHLGLAHNL